MRKVIIGFSSPNKWKLGAEFIKLWQGGTSYSHVYIKSYNTWLEKTIIYQASHGMVNCCEELAFLEHNRVIKEFELVRTDDQYKYTIKNCVDLLGRSYGYIGLILIAISGVLIKIGKFLNLEFKWLNDWGDGQKTFHCSEFAITLIPEIVKYIDKNPDRVEPVDVYNALLKLEADNG